MFLFGVKKKKETCLKSWKQKCVLLTKQSGSSRTTGYTVLGVTLVVLDAQSVAIP